MKLREKAGNIGNPTKSFYNHSRCGAKNMNMKQQSKMRLDVRERSNCPASDAVEYQTVKRPRGRPRKHGSPPKSARSSNANEDHVKPMNRAEEKQSARKHERGDEEHMPKSKKRRRSSKVQTKDASTQTDSVFQEMHAHLGSEHNERVSEDKDSLGFSETAFEALLRKGPMPHISQPFASEPLSPGRLAALPEFDADSDADELTKAVAEVAAVAAVAGPQYNCHITDKNNVKNATGATGATDAATSKPTTPVRQLHGSFTIHSKPNNGGTKFTANQKGFRVTLAPVWNTFPSVTLERHFTEIVRAFHAPPPP